MPAGTALAGDGFTVANVPPPTQRPRTPSALRAALSGEALSGEPQPGR